MAINLEIVIPGHYCSNETLNAKIKDIIRIVGPDRYKQGYWITQDGKSINENLILDGYTLLDTKASEGKFTKGGVVNKRGKKDIMKGFKPIKPKHEIDEEDETESYSEPYSKPIPAHLKPDNVQLEQPQLEQPKKSTPKKIDPLAETKSLLKKATIEQLNDNYEKKYGTRPYKPEIITVPLQIQIPYHLEKLNQICEIFELDTKIISQIIFENLRLPEEVILQILNDKLSGHVISNNNIIPENAHVKSAKSIETIVENKNQKEVESGISEIDSFLNDFFQK